MTQIAVIGAGKMGEALIAGIVAGQESAGDANTIVVVEADESRAADLSSKYGVEASDLGTAVASSELLIFAVKPQHLVDLGKELASTLTSRHIVVSVAAGASLEFLERAFGDQAQFVRAMPNTPALAGKGVTGVSFGPTVSPETRKLVTELLSGVGVVVEIDEQHQDALTSVSGSGPAYFFAFVEALAAGGKAQGLDPATAEELAKQTIIGAAAMLEQTGESATTLRENVTSPNGTTQAALESFADSDLEGIVAKAEAAAAARSVEMTQQLLEQSDQ